MYAGTLSTNGHRMAGIVIVVYETVAVSGQFDNTGSTSYEVQTLNIDSQFFVGVR